eukprot:scaffold765_cov66-Skeletonema_marinoi.AAC.2
MIPLSLDVTKSIKLNCCSKVICNGCNYANQVREIEGRRHPKCPFCRKPIPDTDEECDKQMMKRLEANDPVAMLREGLKQYNKGEYQSAFEYFTRAAELGNADAHYRLSLLYRDGEGVEKDRGTVVHHLEEAAIRGHPDARHDIGCHEWNNNGSAERAVKHWIIAATQGDDGSIKFLINAFKVGLVSKDDLAVALRAHKAAVDATKSSQRDAAV